MFFLMLDTGNFNLFSADAVGLYNGNIAALSTATYSMMPLLKLFRYDKLNRIKQMQTAGISAGEWGSPTDNFSTEYRYDYNGNILSLQRRNANAVLMHRINYTYNTKNNRLQGITATGINSSNYSYDAIGNLANDSGESIGVTWNAMNKVKTVVTPNSTLHFAYSPTGQRQIKKTGDKTEYYLHDATGNIMCVYELSGNYLTVKERTIYGSKRIGVYRQRIQLTAFTGFGQAELLPGSGLVNVLHPSPIISPDGRQYLEGSNRLQVIGVARTTLSVNTLAYKKGTIELKGLSPSIAARPIFLDGAKTAGLRDYELTDHLSNVMAVISDRKLSVDTNNDTITDYYEPQVVSFTDYYPFGFPMAERSGNLSGYRFGFNGQESDNEVYGEGNAYLYKYRMYDSRIIRFWSVDPLFINFPAISSYVFAENKPIKYMDLEGAQTYDPNINPSQDPLLGAQITAEIINGAIDGIGNIIFHGIELFISDEREGRMVRSVLESQGYNLPAYVTNKELGAEFKVRKENREIVVKAENGIIRDVLELGISIIDVVAVLYPSNGSAFFFKEGGIAIKSVNKMSEFFIKSDFGQSLAKISDRTNFIQKEQRVYKVTKKNENLGLNKGDYFYLDNAHKDHIEVFNANGDFKKVLNLDGTLNKAKTAAGEGRTIKVN